MKRTLLSIALGALAAIVVSMFFFNNKLSDGIDAAEKMMEEKNEKENALIEQQIAFEKRLEAKADTALSFAKEQGFDLDHIFLVDFSLHSGKNRFFVWDYSSDSILYASLCAHGVGKGSRRSTYTNIKYSNEEGSFCSSLGKYKTGARFYSNWGINVHYKLHGLEDTNNNAFKRIVVLHSYGPIPNYEIYPQHIPLGYSQGCPVINDEVMTEVDKLMQGKSKPLLLWIYN